MGTVKIIHKKDLHLGVLLARKNHGSKRCLGAKLRTMKLLKSLPVGSPDKTENSRADQDGRVSLEQKRTAG